jgi:hypothetical protein
MFLLSFCSVLNQETLKAFLILQPLTFIIKDEILLLKLNGLK